MGETAAWRVARLTLTFVLAGAQLNDGTEFNFNSAALFRVGKCGNPKDTVLYPFRGFQLSHLLKAGGTFAHGATNGAVEGSRNIDAASSEALWKDSTFEHAQCRGCRFPSRHKIDYELCGADPAAPLFVIQLIREPCSYYASVYGFQTRKADHAMARKCYRYTGESEDSQPDFKTWIKEVHRGSHRLGFMAHRLWASANRSVYPAGLPLTDDGQLAECVRELPEKLVDQIKQMYAEPREKTMFKNVNCWVDQNYLVSDLVSCLRQFATAVGKPQKTLFSTYLDRMAKSAAQYADHSYTNRHCNKLFNTSNDDGRTARELVTLLERDFHSAFGDHYSCCKTPATGLADNPPRFMSLGNA